MEEAKAVILFFSILWGAWAALALWVMNGKPWPKVREPAWGWA